MCPDLVSTNLVTKPPARQGLTIAFIPVVQVRENSRTPWNRRDLLKRRLIVICSKGCIVPQDGCKLLSSQSDSWK